MSDLETMEREAKELSDQIKSCTQEKLSVKARQEELNDALNRLYAKIQALKVGADHPELIVTPKE